MSNNDLQNTLTHFFGGGPNYFNSISNKLGFHYTEGVKYLQDNGAHWLVSDTIIKLGMDKKVHNAHSVKFIPNEEGGGATVYYTTNPLTGDSVEIDRQEYESCSINFPITFFIGETLDNSGRVCNLLMLSNEY